MGSPAVELHDVSVTFPVGRDLVRALSGVSVAIGDASSTAIVGRSGSGKSTLISVLALLRSPSSGQVLVNGAETHGWPDRKLARLRGRWVGTVFQSFHLDPAFTVRENVMLPWYFTGSGRRAQARRQADELLAAVGISDLAPRSPTTLSGGERQRVGIARALFCQPRFLVADEPTGNLDETTAMEVAQLLYSLPAAFGTAVVIVTHDAQIAQQAERRLTLSRGQITGDTARTITAGAP